MGLIVKNVDKSFSTKKVVDNINFEILQYYTLS